MQDRVYLVAMMLSLTSYACQGIFPVYLVSLGFQGGTGEVGMGHDVGVFDFDMVHHSNPPVPIDHQSHQEAHWH